MINAFVLLGVLSIGSAVVYDLRTTVSVLFGGVLSLLNMKWMMAVADSLLRRSDPQPGFGDAVKYLLRLVLIFGIVFAMIRFSFLGLWGVLAGFSIFVFSTILEAIRLIIEQVGRSR